MTTGHRPLRFTPAELNHLGLVGLGLIHELGNPLSAMQLSLDLLIEQIEGGETPDSETLLGRLRNERQRLKKTTDLIHRFRRLLAHKPPVLQTIELGRVVADVLDDLRVTLRQFGISHVENKGNARIRFRTDDVWLRQILSCLILNGAQAVGSASANGWVQVNYSSEKDWVHISVSDNGGGLKQAAELGKTTKSDGLGIGLMLADTLTSNLGGTLSLVNGPVGLMAIVKLPLNQGET